MRSEIAATMRCKSKCWPSASVVRRPHPRGSGGRASPNARGSHVPHAATSTRASPRGCGRRICPVYQHRRGEAGRLPGRVRERGGVTLSACKRALKGVFVNIFDYVDFVNGKIKSLVEYIYTDFSRFRRRCRKRGLYPFGAGQVVRPQAAAPDAETRTSFVAA